MEVLKISLITIISIAACFLLVILFIILLAFTCVAGINYIDYRLNDSYCSLYIENKKVYEGRCHYLQVDSIGENGNSKLVTIYKDVLKLQPDKNFISESVLLRGMENDK